MFSRLNAQRTGRRHRSVPKRISDDEEDDVLFVCIVQYRIAVGLYHVPIGEKDGFPIEGFLRGGDYALRSGYVCGATDQPFFWDHEDAGVGFEVDPGGRADSLWVGR